MSMAFWILTAGGVVAFGAAILFHALFTAPTGYEDQAGFHAAKPTPDMSDEYGCGNPS